MGVPQLHIGGISGIADIEGIKQQCRAIIMLLQLANNPVNRY